MKIPMIRILKLKFFFISVLVFILLFLTISAQAAELYVDTSRDEYGSGDIFIANLKIDVQGECVNAIKADMNFSNDLLEAVDFMKSDSILIFWVEEPAIDQNRGIVSFAGGIPGGYCGKIAEGSNSDSVIGKIAFRAKGENLRKAESKIAEIKFLETSEVLLNDGSGTKASLSGQGIGIKITAETGLARDEWSSEKSGDNIPPESFKIEIKKDPLVFDGKYFIVFGTFDKQTGVGRYEIKEGEGQWKTAGSPYLLADQSLKSEIAVKAVDKAGNERIEKAGFTGSRNISKTKIAIYLFSLMILIIAGFGIFKFINNKFKK